MAEFIFLIGPGGAGKSSVGKRLAARLGYAAWDLDDLFCERISNIREYIALHGYEAYLEENSMLLETLLEEASTNSVFILSSGFLATDIRGDIVTHNRKRVQKAGISVLLLPSNDYHEAFDCIIERQLRRGFGLKRESEALKFSQRFEQYMQLGDIQIFSDADPETVTRMVIDRLATLKRT